MTRRRRIAAFVLLAATLLLWRPAGAHVRAASLLVRFADPDARGVEGLVAAAARHPLVEQEVAISGTLPVRARAYVPTDVAHPSGIVLLHGVHYLGMDEPRLRRFARTIASSGVLVLTPEIRELCDYRIDPASLEVIGASARALSERLDGARVGLMGLSFAGGLSLVAASDARYAAAIGFVVAVGAHDDLGRVLRFFLTNEAPRPDGTDLRLHAHDYGPVVLVYSHADDFFPGADLPAARDTLRLWLHEDFDAARARAQSLSPPAAAKMRHVLDHDTAALGPELAAEIARLGPAFDAVSPNAHLADIRVPVFLLHGAGDTVIPSSETEWLAHDTPRALLRTALVTRAIEHVELDGQASLGERVELVHFLSDVLEAADDVSSVPSP
jgi:dienelactone hydrolase